MTFITLQGIVIIPFNIFAASEHKDLILAAIGKDRRGVYVYLDAEYKALYVGKSNQLITRLKQQSSEQGIEKKFDWKFLGVIFCEENHLKEANLIKQLQPPFNHLGK